MYLYVPEMGVSQSIFKVIKSEVPRKQSLQLFFSWLWTRGKKRCENEGCELWGIRGGVDRQRWG